MDKNVKKVKNVIFLIVAFVFLMQMLSFATSYENANVVIGPNSTEWDQMHIDGKNYALESLQNVMEPKDFLMTMIYVSDYRKGEKDAIHMIRELVGKYNLENIDQIINYIIQDNNVKLLATYRINHLTNQLNFIKIDGLTTGESVIDIASANKLWKEIVTFVPEEFSNNITTLYIDFNKGDDNLITINSSINDAVGWEMAIDARLMFDDQIDALCKNLIYATAFYYILKNDQVDPFNTKDNYVFQNRTYKTDSYINQFYKKFWKGRRKEVNTNQYDLYKSEFFNTKASRTVYDDMAVSFYNYVINGVMHRYLGFKADKNNFFEEYEVFRDIAKKFRIKLGIKMS